MKEWFAMILPVIYIAINIIIKLAFISHNDLMDLRCVIFKVPKAFECELPISIAGKWAVLPGLKLIMPIEVAFQRLLTAKVLLSFI